VIALAKAALDVGLFTCQREAMLAFWQQQAGVPFRELLPLGAGLQQHRHAIGDSVLKINHSREPLPDAPAGGIRALVIARAGIDMPQTLTDPDGNRVTLVPPGEVAQLRVELTVSDLAAHRRFYGEVLGLPAHDHHTFLCGASQIRLIEGEAARDPEQRAPGYRYLTLQVYDVHAAHGAILAQGGREGRPPVRLGDVASISFVRDPDGNWIEVSQRKSITGSLD
jgi:catechol 2,3-dioxygenase-like lactoylglutathione lyase family enzyme